MSENQIIEIDMNIFTSNIENPPAIIKITKSNENSSDFDELCELQEENNNLRLKGRKNIAKVVKKENLMKKVRSEFEMQERCFINEQNIFHEQWIECRRRFDDLKMVFDNLRNQIREEELNRETVVAVEDGEIIRLYQQGREE